MILSSGVFSLSWVFLQSSEKGKLCQRAICPQVKTESEKYRPKNGAMRDAVRSEAEQTESPKETGNFLFGPISQSILYSRIT